MSHGQHGRGCATRSDFDNDYDDGCGGGCIFDDDGPSCSTSYMPRGGLLQRSDHFQGPHAGPQGIRGTTMSSGSLHGRPVQQQDIPHGRPAASVAGLDLFQSAVVSSSASTSLVVRSCAGSGKSTTLAVRAGELLARGLPPERLLVLTFSVRSKDDLHAKMQVVFPPGARLPRVQTHHAHALLIARSAGCTARVVSASEQRKIVRELLGDKAHGGGGSGGGSGGRASVPKESVKAALHTIAKAKSSMTKPRAPKEVQLMSGYQSALRRLGCIDFEDMTSLACAALDDEPPGARYAHVMLDEAQDTSESQLALVTKLAPRGVTAITAVGDADQTIVSRWDGPNLALPSPNPWVWMW
jgi:superfamily I DNA/RNA helicase